MVFKKIIFQNSYVELETPPLHGENHLKFPFWLFERFPYFLLKRMFDDFDNRDKCRNQAFWETIYTLLAFLWFFKIILQTKTTLFSLPLFLCPSVCLLDREFVRVGFLEWTALFMWAFLSAFEGAPFEYVCLCVSVSEVCVFFEHVCLNWRVIFCSPDYVLVWIFLCFCARRCWSFFLEDQ